MVLLCQHADRSSRQLITYSPKRRPDSVPVSTRGKERTMLNAAYGMLAMLPVAFWVAGYAMVSR
jgi:hypothetical protein